MANRRKNILMLGHDSEPTKYGKKLMVEIQRIVDSLNLPAGWQFNKSFKGDLYTDKKGTIHPPNSWVMEFYINDSQYEQFVVRDNFDLPNIEEAKKKLMS